MINQRRKQSWRRRRPKSSHSFPAPVPRVAGTPIRPRLLRDLGGLCERTSSLRRFPTRGPSPSRIRFRPSYGSPFQGSGRRGMADPGRRSPAGSLALGYDAAALQAFCAMRFGAGMRAYGVRGQAQRDTASFANDNERSEAADAIRGVRRGRASLVPLLKSGVALRLPPPGHPTGSGHSREVAEFLIFRSVLLLLAPQPQRQRLSTRRAFIQPVFTRRSGSWQGAWQSA